MTRLFSFLLLPALLAGAQEVPNPKPARILKPVAVPQKLQAACLQIAPDVDVQLLAAFFDKQVPGLTKRIEARLPADFDRLIANDDDGGEDLERRRDEARRLAELLEKMTDDFRHYQDLLEDDAEHADVALRAGRNEYACIMLAMDLQDLRKAGEEEHQKEIEATEQRLRDELEKLFDAKIAAQKEELKWMEKEVEELKRIIQKKEKYRKQIVEKKFLELSGELENLDF